MPDAAHHANLVFLAGAVVDPPRVRRSPAGTPRASMTVAVRSAGPPRRVDAIPITWWDPPEPAHGIGVGTPIAVVGFLRRRFWATEQGRSSRIEVHATTVDFDGAGGVDDYPAPTPCT